MGDESVILYLAGCHLDSIWQDPVKILILCELVCFTLIEILAVTVLKEDYEFFFSEELAVYIGLSHDIYHIEGLGL